MTKYYKNMELISTNYGGKKLIYDGYIYIKDKDSEDSTYWRCEKRGLCNSRMITLRTNGSVKKSPLTHSHQPDLASIEAVKTVEAIKLRSTLTEEVTSSVIQKSTNSISIAAALKLPSKESLSKIVRRKRKHEEVDVDAPLYTTRGQQFLISNNPEIDLLILGTEENIRMLARYQNWFCDGTFDSAPIGHQLYTVHSLVSETVTIPLIFCITKDKTELTYRKIFSTLKEHYPSLQPETIMIDFERASINAIEQNFPTAELQGCFFHFGQAIWRQIQGLGLQHRYQNEDEFGVIMKQFRALAFVPAIDVIACYEELIDSLSDELVDDLSDFLHYFEKTWIGLEHHGRRRRPLFPIKLWNVRDRVERALPRTNNSVEGWHRAFDIRINITHPCVSKLIRKIIMEQNDNEITLEKVRSGHQLPQSKKKYIQLNKRIEKMVDGYIYIPHLEYLRGISQNLSF